MEGSINRSMENQRYDDSAPFIWQYGFHVNQDVSVSFILFVRYYESIHAYLATSHRLAQQREYHIRNQSYQHSFTLNIVCPRYCLSVVYQFVMLTDLKVSFSNHWENWKTSGSGNWLSTWNGLDNCLARERRQAIIWSKGGLLHRRYDTISYL